MELPARRRMKEAIIKGCRSRLIESVASMAFLIASGTANE
jgi:hypothetical protein